MALKPWVVGGDALRPEGLGLVRRGGIAGLPITGTGTPEGCGVLLLGEGEGGLRL